MLRPLVSDHIGALGELALVPPPLLFQLLSEAQIHKGGELCALSQGARSLLLGLLPVHFFPQESHAVRPKRDILLQRHAGMLGGQGACSPFGGIIETGRGGGGGQGWQSVRGAIPPPPFVWTLGDNSSLAAVGGDISSVIFLLSKQLIKKNHHKGGGTYDHVFVDR